MQLEDAEPDSLTAATDRLRAEVGWRPPRTFEQRMSDTVAWWQARLSDGR